jgi:hypothetical protein
MLHHSCSFSLDPVAALRATPRSGGVARQITSFGKAVASPGEYVLKQKSSASRPPAPPEPPAPSAVPILGSKSDAVLSEGEKRRQTRQK